MFCNPTKSRQLVGGFNPIEKYSSKSKWIISPNRGEHKKYSKPPPRTVVRCGSTCHRKISVSKPPNLLPPVSRPRWLLAGWEDMRVSQSLEELQSHEGWVVSLGRLPCMSFDSMHGIPNGGKFSWNFLFFWVGLVGTILLSPKIGNIYIYIRVFSKYTYI